MTALSDNSNLPEIFRNCDDRVFAFGRDKLPHKSQPINVIPLEDLEDAINVLAAPYRCNQISNGIRLVLRHLHNLRYFHINKVKYTWPFEARWESNETLQNHFRWNSGKLKVAWQQAKKYGLLHNTAKKGQCNRLFRLHDDVIKLAKMTKPERDEWLQSQVANGRNTTISNGGYTTISNGGYTTISNGRYTTIELSNKENKKLTNKVNQLPSGYPQASRHMTEDQYDELAKTDMVNPIEDQPADPSSHSDRVNNDMVKNDMDLEKMDIHKRDIITAWRKEFFQTTNGKACYKYFGGNFFDIFYSDLSDYLKDQGHNKRVSLIEKLGLEIFGHIVFGEADNPYKLSFESHQNAGHSCAVNYLKTNNFKTLKKAAYEAIDKPEPHEVIPPSPKPEKPDRRALQALAERIDALGMGTYDSALLAIKFDQEFTKQLTRLRIDTVKHDKILLEIVDNDNSWGYVKSFWQEDRFLDQLWTNSSMQSLLKRSETYKSIIKVKNEKGAQELVEMVTRANASRPKGQHIYYEGAAN